MWACLGALAGVTVGSHTRRGGGSEPNHLEGLTLVTDMVPRRLPAKMTICMDGHRFVATVSRALGACAFTTEAAEHGAAEAQ